MTTWGPSKKPPQNRARTGGVPTSRTSKTTAASRGGVRDATPPSTSRNRRTRARASCAGGRGHASTSSSGSGSSASGCCSAWRSTSNLAGPLGRGHRDVVGWLTGLGRFVAARSCSSPSASRWSARAARRARSGCARLGSGRDCARSGCCTSSAGPTRSRRRRRARRAGGWLGALVGEPLAALIASGGAAVVLLARVRRRSAARSRRPRCGRWRRTPVAACGRRRASRSAVRTQGDRRPVDAEQRARPNAAAGADGQAMAGEASATRLPPTLYDLAARATATPWAAAGRRFANRRSDGRSQAPSTNRAAARRRAAR